MIEEDDPGPPEGQEVKVTIGRYARICTFKTSTTTTCNNRHFGDPDWICPEHGARSTIDQPDRPYKVRPQA